MGNAGSKLATLNAEQKETLNHLYDNMLQLQESDQVIFDIREAVREIVRDIATKIGDIDKRFKIGDIILVGSAMEGTRNISANEYDFLLVLDVLSQPEVISVKQNCQYSDGHVHITVENNDIKTQYKDMLSDGKLIGSDMDLLWIPIVRSLRHFFGNVLEDTVKNVFNHVSVKMSTGSLSFSSKEVQLHGPAFKLMLNWQENGNADTEISVDLCPVIRYMDYHKLIKPENAACQTYFDYVEKVQSVMLMPFQPKHTSLSGGALCFNVTFTLAELMLTMDLSDHHRKCYKILKFLLNGKELITTSFMPHLKEAMRNQFIVRPPTMCSSFALKMFVLKHHYHQQCQSQCLVECMETLLREISSFIETRNTFDMQNMSMYATVPSLFFPVQVKYDPDFKYSLRNVLRKLEKISNLEPYEYENCLLENDAIRVFKPFSNWFKVLFVGQFGVGFFWYCFLIGLNPWLIPVGLAYCYIVKNCRVFSIKRKSKN